MNRVIAEDIKDILSADINWNNLINSRVLVTGASGMLGKYMLYVLTQLNREKDYGISVYAMVRNPSKIPQELADQINIIKHDVTEPVDTDVEFDYIINAASPASPKIMKEHPVETAAANSIGTYNTLKLTENGKCKGYLYISSREIYGQPYDDQDVFTEDTYGFVDPLDVRSCYPEGKKAAENMCICFREQHGLNVKIARLAHTFGPGMPVDDGRVQADFLRNVINRENIVMKSEGTAVRTYTYVSDAVKALFMILLNTDDVVYNIASEESTVSIRMLAETLIEAFPERHLELVMDIPERKEYSGTAPFTKGILSSEKIRNAGWVPTYSLKEGLVRTVEYLES